MPPFLLIHGTKDEDVPYEQSVEMREKAMTAGGHCDVIPVDGAPNGMDHWESRAELLWYKKARTDWLKKMVKWCLLPFTVEGRCRPHRPAGRPFLSSDRPLWLPKQASANCFCGTPMA